MKSVMLTIAESEVGKLKAIAEQLTKEGLTITNLYDYGVIAGVADDTVIKRLKQHKEVISLTEEKQVHINPPESEIQ